MKKFYIPFVNNKVAASPGATPARWREQQETAFLALSTTTPLTTDINSVRLKWDTPGHGGVCRPKYVTELHEKKQVRQERWLAYLEKAVCETLDTAVMTVMTTYYQAVKNAKADVDLAKKTPGNAAGIHAAMQRLTDAEKAANDILLVAALPEFFWRDVNDEKKHTDATKSDFIVGYGKPLYPATFEQLIDGKLSAPAAVINTTTTPNTLCELTYKHANLVVFAGTVWWKKIVDAGSCGHAATCPKPDLPVGTVESACTAALPRCEKMFNTMPVFYQGKCISLWNKQWISSIDGLGNNYDNTQKYVNRSFALSAFVGGTTPATSGTVIGLSSKFKFADKPLVQISRGSDKITFGMDICLDFAQGYDHIKKEATDNPMSMDILGVGNEPDIQMLIAGGMPVTDATIPDALDPNYVNNIFAKSHMLRCDVFKDDAKNYADVWKVGAPKRETGFDVPTAACKPFGVVELK